MTCSVVCVLRSTVDYKPRHVERLYQDVKRWWPAELPLRFIVLTDTLVSFPGIEERPLWNKWKGQKRWWSKMELFDGAQDDLGDILFFDLDTMIVGSLEQVAQSRPLTLLQDFYHPERVQSGMMYLPLADRPFVSAAFWQDPNEMMASFAGDGEFLDWLFRGSVATWQDVLKEEIVSYKVHVRRRIGQTIPPDARVVCFHGRPRPWSSPLWERV